MARPDTSVTPVVIAAVYKVCSTRALVGAKVAVEPEQLTVPATEAPLSAVRVKVPVVRVVQLTGLLNIALRDEFNATPPASRAGTVDRT
jgi:hypothetical protein